MLWQHRGYYYGQHECPGKPHALGTRAWPAGMLLEALCSAIMVPAGSAYARKTMVFLASMELWGTVCSGKTLSWPAWMLKKPQSLVMQSLLSLHSICRPSSLAAQGTHAWHLHCAPPRLPPGASFFFFTKMITFSHDRVGARLQYEDLYWCLPPLH